MKYLAIFLFLTCGACLSSDDININGKDVTDASVTEVTDVVPTNSSTVGPSTTPNPKTTVPTTNSTTTTTTTTTTPKSVTTSTVNPNSTTTPKPTEPTTPKSSTNSPTVTPIVTTASPHHDRKFDGPSFVGGIILALGLVAIGFVAFKFYKARTEMNYHTL